MFSGIGFCSVSLYLVRRLHLLWHIQDLIEMMEECLKKTLPLIVAIVGIILLCDGL